MTGRNDRLRRELAREEAADNAAAMPGVKALVDDVRQVFGADVRVVWCWENGIEKGVDPTAEPGSLGETGNRRSG